ncbi:MAG: 50S ribosomal protein L25 [Candidatus Saccharibacteria bacterium]
MDEIKGVLMSGQELIALNLDKRDVLGKSVKHLRRDGILPAVIHDHGKDSHVVMGDYSEIYKAYKNAGKHHPIEITLGKAKYTALIKFVEFNPKTNKLNHIVFNAVDANQTVEAEIPVHIIGDSPAVKTGLLVIHMLDHVEVESVPSKLPDELTVDASTLVEIGDKLTVADIVVPEGVIVKTEPEHTIAVVEETKAQLSEESEEEVAEEGAEPAKPEADSKEQDKS